MAAPFTNPYNVNVGVLGHVDSGKTSIVAALSTTLSTAALDKNPQSRQRGITLDLGFSSFMEPAPPDTLFAAAGHDAVQFTLVDCPGHASLIRTVVGGAQIMDAMLLVVDVTKGIQTQTAECIVIGEITTDTMVVALNKIDLLDPEKKEKHIKKAKKLVAATLAATKFAGCRVVPVAARPNAFEEGAVPEGILQLKQALMSAAFVRPAAAADDSFLFLIDHCFAVKGQGTVMTGTVARGQLAVGDTLELPALKQQKKVKSMQVFRRAVQACKRGDRVGICVTQLEAGAVERGLAAAPGTVATFAEAILSLEKVRFYPGDVRSTTKMHVMVGHATVMAKLSFFGLPRGASSATAAAIAPKASVAAPEFDFGQKYMFQDALYGDEGRPAEDEGGTAAAEELAPHHGPQWAYAQFDEPVTVPLGSLVIGARLDANLDASTCRIACAGRICAPYDSSIASLRVYKLKTREGVIERVEADGCTAVCRGMFGKDSDMSKFVGMEVQGPQGQRGTLEGTFGKSGKFKARFPGGVAVAQGQAPARVVLVYKRHMFDPDNRKKVAQ